MSAVQDPAFWKRFSMAVHQDEEKAISPVSRSTSNTSSDKSVKQQHADDWLYRTQKKSRKSLIVGCTIALVVLLVILAIVVVLLWLGKVGPFDQHKKT